jgi:hypothetical protein
MSTFVSISWIEFGFNRSQNLGVHINCQVDGYQHIECKAIAYFYFNDGRPLKDFNNSYRTINGDVSSLEYHFTPIDPSSTFNDLVISIPYQELHLDPGTFNLKVFVCLFTVQPQYFLATSNDYYFSFEQPLILPPPIPPPITTSQSSKGQIIISILFGIGILTFLAVISGFPVGIIITIGLAGISFAINFNQ